MGATNWDARVRREDDFRSMKRDERSAFHRELMNALRATQEAA
jgi:hypothetical protein